MHSYMVEPLYVKSDHEVIAADFYRPKSIEKPAVILMAHGLAALRHFKLVQYAQHFAQAGTDLAGGMGGLSPWWRLDDGEDALFGGTGFQQQGEVVDEIQQFVDAHDASGEGR